MRASLLLIGTAAIAAAAGSAALLVIVGVHRVLQLPTDWPWDAHADVAAQGALALLAIAALLLLALVICCCCTSAEGASADSLDEASIASKLSFWWAMPTLTIALRNGKLEPPDLPQLPLADRPERLYDRFVVAWARRRRQRGPWRLTFLGAFGVQRAVCLQSFVAGWLFQGCMFVDPILLHSLLQAEATVEPGSGAELAEPSGASAPTSSMAWLWRQLGLVGLLSLSMVVRVTCMELCCARAPPASRCRPPRRVPPWPLPPATSARASRASARDRPSRAPTRARTHAGLPLQCPAAPPRRARAPSPTLHPRPSPLHASAQHDAPPTLLHADFYSARTANNFRSMLLLGVFRSTVASSVRAEGASQLPHGMQVLTTAPCLTGTRRGRSSAGPRGRCRGRRRPWWRAGPRQCSPDRWSGPGGRASVGIGQGPLEQLERSVGREHGQADKPDGHGRGPHRPDRMDDMGGAPHPFWRAPCRALCALRRVGHCVSHAASGIVCPAPCRALCASRSPWMTLDGPGWPLRAPEP